MFYSSTTNGFYAHPIHGINMPDDVVEIDDATHAALLQGQAEGKIISADANGYPILIDQPPPAVVDVATARIAALSSDCEAAIVGGFSSAALGTPHTYQSDRDDQTNLLGSHATATATGQSVPHKCQDAAGTWAYRLHTPAQMTQVLADGAAVKLQHLQHFGALRDQVLAIVAANALLPEDPDYLTDDAARAAIEAVTW